MCVFFTPDYTCPVSEGPKESHLGGVWPEEPCHTGAQCGAPPTRAGHGRAVPATLEPPAAAEDSHLSTSSPLNGSDGQRRSGEAA